MRELSYVIAAMAGLVLLAAAGAWFKIARNPKNDLIKGAGGNPETKRVRRASRLIAMAFVLSSLALFIAVIAWFLRLLKI